MSTIATGAGPIEAMGEAEQVAVGLLRQAVRSGPSGYDTGDGGTLVRAACQLCEAAIETTGEDVGSTSIRLDLAAPQEPGITLDERGLLRALAAAQHHEEAVLNSALVSLAPGRARRLRLSEAVRSLAAALAASGRLLAGPAMLRWALPAAALTVARLHGHDLGGAEIAWPPRD